MNKRILLLEDNPISREFLHEALLPLGMRVDVADTLANSVAFARDHAYALLLCDVHVPDGGPIEIFQALDQWQSGTKIVAITAEIHQSIVRELMDIGYMEVWGKPISMQTLQDNILRLLGMKNADSLEAIPHTELWDEVAALRAVGNNQATLTALRNMFLAELPQQTKIIRDAFAGKHITELKAECHKLLAGCGFVGASGLMEAIRRLSEKPDDHEHFKHAMQQAEHYLAEIR